MLRYVTTNEGKVREAREYINCEQFDYDYTEIQSSDIGTIAAHGAREAHREVDEPVLVDDTGLFVDVLNGFPGPYSSYVEDTLGIERVHELVAGEDDRRAAFRCVLAYCDGAEFAASPDPVDRDDRALAAARDADESGAGVPVKLFAGTVRGRIVPARGEGGFGYDPIFEHEGTTMAEMDTAEKNAISHRGRALAKFGEWFAER
jgi:XTP/dITP diphosphohydrolase